MGEQKENIPGPGRRPPLCGSGHGRQRRAARLRLQAMQIVGGPLCVSCCAENRALVFAQHVEPVANVIGVIRADLRCDAEVGAKEGGAKFRDQLLAAVPGISDALFEIGDDAVYHAGVDVLGQALFAVFRLRFFFCQCRHIGLLGVLLNYGQQGAAGKA
jgi:hypothetical protein